jgi:hypothetical protein
MTNECLNQPQPQDPKPRLQAGGGVVTRTTACDLFVHLLVLNRGTTACDLFVHLILILNRRVRRWNVTKSPPFLRL